MTGERAEDISGPGGGATAMTSGPRAHQRVFSFLSGQRTISSVAPLFA